MWYSPSRQIVWQVPARGNCNSFLIDIDYEAVAVAQGFVLIAERPDYLLNVAPFGMRLPAAVTVNLVQPHSPAESIEVDDLVAA